MGTRHSCSWKRMPLWSIMGKGAYRLRKAEPTKIGRGSKGRPAPYFLERSPMRKIISGTLFMALAGTLAIATPRQDRDDHRDRGEKHDKNRHEGDDRHGDDRGDRHDNGNHRGWDNERASAQDALIPTAGTSTCEGILSPVVWISGRVV